MGETSIEQKESMSSFEFGKANSRFKIYFWTIDELQAKLMEIGKLKTTEEWLTTLNEEKK